MVENLIQAPVLIKVLCTLLAILALNMLSKKLFLSLIFGALLLAFWTGQNLQEMSVIASERVFSINNIMLVLTVSQVMWLARQMQQTGFMEELVSTVRGKTTKRGAMAVLPAVIGFLPMPGGALFSAPMLQSCDPENHTSSSLKTITNHWFRHIWECWWPMYPGVLLTMELTGFDVPQMLLLGMPISFAAILFGYLLLLRRISHETETACGKKHNQAGFFKALRVLTPIAVVVITYAAVRIGHSLITYYYPTFPDLNRYLPMNIGLLFSMIYLQTKKPLSVNNWKKLLLSKHVLSMVMIVLAVRIYGAFIEAESPGSGYLVEQMRSELAEWGIPLTVIIMILPFITGLATGMAVGYIGASFPIVLSLIGSDPSFGEMLSVTTVAYGFGYMGFVLSPVHICLIVTCKHFKTTVLRSLAGMLPPAFLVLITTLALGRFWEWVLP